MTSPYRIPVPDENGRFKDKHLPERLSGPSLDATYLRNENYSPSAEVRQSDYVELLRGLSDYGSMTVTRITGTGQLRVECQNSKGDYLRYGITSATLYQYVGDIVAAKIGSGEYYDAPSPVFPTDFSPEGAYVGWDAANNTFRFTNVIGASWATSIVTTKANAKIDFSSYVDDRGGMWRVSLVEAPSVTADFSVWNATATQKLHSDVLTVPVPGSYTLRGEFIGNDPDHEPSQTSRGWMENVSRGRFVRIRELDATQESQLSVQSNKDIAISLKPTGGGSRAFVPFHGTQTETFATPTVYLKDGAPVALADMPLNTPIECKSFEVVQHIHGRNEFTGTQNLIEIWSKQRFTPDGTYAVAGRWKTLADVHVGPAYAMMMPFCVPLFDEVVSTLGVSYAVAPSQDSTVNLWVNEGDKQDGFVALSSTTPDVVAAVRYTNPMETLRAGRAGKPVRDDRKTFIERRSGGSLAKVYSTMYETETLVPTGTVQRFSGDFWFGRVPGARSLLSLS